MNFLYFYIAHFLTNTIREIFCPACALLVETENYGERWIPQHALSFLTANIAEPPPRHPDFWFSC